jgi:hypothetical protein
MQMGQAPSYASIGVSTNQSNSMKAYETSTIVEPQGDVRIVAVPFAPGTEVDVTISPKRKSAEEFAHAWQRLTNELRELPQSTALSDEDIQQEVNEYRAGR